MNLKKEGVTLPATVAILISALVGFVAQQFGWTAEIAEAVGIAAEYVALAIIAVAWALQALFSRGKVWSEESHDAAVNAALRRLPPEE